MDYTELNTINEIMKYPGIEKLLYLFYPREFVDMVPKEKRDMPIKDLKESIRMPWGMPYISDELLLSVNTAISIMESQAYLLLPLWGEVDGKTKLDFDAGDKQCVCLMVKKCMEAQKKPAVIICPGGGYATLSTVGEGIAMAEWMAQAGYQPFVLAYRVTPNNYPEPQMDLALAVKYIRANADKYRIEPGNVMVMGSSAGGHLCASEAALLEEIDGCLNQELEEISDRIAGEYREISARPDKVCLNYALISFMDRMDVNINSYFQNLSGGNEGLREKLSIERQVDAGFPKTYLWHCNDDGLVNPQNSVLMEQALTEQGVEHAFHLYPTGDHGCGIATGTSAEGWMDEMLEFMRDKK